MVGRLRTIDWSCQVKPKQDNREWPIRWKELQEVLLDVEITLNNRPLSYVEDDVQMPLLTPNAMLFANSNLLPELQPHHIETADLGKRAKHLLK